MFPERWIKSLRAQLPSVRSCFEGKDIRSCFIEELRNTCADAGLVDNDPASSARTDRRRRPTFIFNYLDRLFLQHETGHNGRRVAKSRGLFILGKRCTPSANDYDGSFVPDATRGAVYGNSKSIGGTRQEEARFGGKL